MRRTIREPDVTSGLFLVHFEKDVNKGLRNRRLTTTPMSPAYPRGNS